jgi:hypothetical protein
MEFGINTGEYFMKKKTKKYINPCELTAVVTAAANLLAKELTDDELNLLSAVLMQLADTLAVIAVVRDLNAEACGENAVDSDNADDPTPPAQEQKASSRTEP